MKIKNFITTIFVHRFLYRLYKILYIISLKGMGYCNYESPFVSGELFVLNKYFKNGKPTILDVGANIGEYSLLVNQINPRATIHAFEPSKHAFNKLKSNCKKKNIILHNYGLGNKNESVTLYDRNGEDGSGHASVFEDVIKEIHHKNVSRNLIKIKSLDQVVKSLSIKLPIDLLKIDIEGNEYKALKGAKELIDSGNINHIQIEVNGMNVYSRVFLHDFIKFLSNYNLHLMYPDGLIKIDNYDPMYHEIFAFHNIFAIRKY